MSDALDWAAGEGFEQYAERIGRDERSAQQFRQRHMTELLGIMLKLGGR